jgi:hypothetical protein
LPRGYNRFEFEVIGYRDECLIVGIVAVHGINYYSVGEIICIETLKTLN